MKPDQTPTVGRIVHCYVTGDPTPLAAIVTQVHEDEESVAEGAVNLAVFGPAGWAMDPALRISFGTPHETEYPDSIWTENAHWVWPPRVEPPRGTTT